MSDIRSKIWIEMEEAVEILNTYDYLKVTISKQNEKPTEKGKNYFYAAKMITKFGFIIEFRRCFGKPMVREMQKLTVKV